MPEPEKNGKCPVERFKTKKKKFKICVVSHPKPTDTAKTAAAPSSFLELPGSDSESSEVKADDGSGEGSGSGEGLGSGSGSSEEASSDHQMLCLTSSSNGDCPTAFKASSKSYPGQMWCYTNTNALFPNNKKYKVGVYKWSKYLLKSKKPGKEIDRNQASASESIGTISSTSAEAAINEIMSKTFERMPKKYGPASNDKRKANTNQRPESGESDALITVVIKVLRMKGAKSIEGAHATFVEPKPSTSTTTISPQSASGADAKGAAEGGGQKKEGQGGNDKAKGAAESDKAKDAQGDGADKGKDDAGDKGKPTDSKAAEGEKGKPKGKDAEGEKGKPTDNKDAAGGKAGAAKDKAGKAGKGKEGGEEDMDQDVL
eukprot:g4883.t1